MEFLTPSHAWWAALAVPVIVVYFLKLKRPRLTVPSLVLWARVMQDQRVNSPFQRFRRHLLLLLQLLLLLALVLAATQPVSRGDVAGSGHLPVLIDVSASMAASDSTGRSRLDEAKEQVAALIDGLAGDRQIALVAVGARARRLTGFTDNARVLHAALDALAVDETGADLGAALRLAQAMARSAAVSDVILYSDGNVSLDRALELPFSVDYRLVGPAAANIGITAVRARRALDGDWEVLVVVRAVGAVGSGTVRVVQHGRALGSQNLTLDNGDNRRLLFRLPAAALGMVSIELRSDGIDSLASDNLAYLTLPKARALRVQLGESMEAWRRALQAHQELDLVRADVAADLAIVHSADVTPAPVTVSVGSIPKAVADMLDRRDAGTGVVDWNHASPLLRHAGLGEVLFARSVLFAPGMDEASLEGRGWRIAVHGENGPLALEQRRGETVHYAWLIDLDFSTLPYRVAFPVMVANAVQEARTRAGLGEVAAVRTGVVTAGDLPAGSSVAVRGPGVELDALPVDAEGRLGGIAASRVGLYQLSGDGFERELGVALLDEFETSLLRNEELQLGTTAATASGDDNPGDWPWWRPLAALALGLLLVEWWWYQRPAGGWR
ncbi:MAG: BatA and WFA domain-containing protein [Planctomycetota bacterium]|jgi:Ca-activated chloride channel family protein|nr:BatA and WFA domain-containing protein [Planctomycetota bacterium]